MTTVCAIARDGKVWMAADSRNNVYERPVPGAARKIRRVTVDAANGQLLLGLAGDGAMQYILGKLHVDYLPDDDDAQIWADAIASAITELAYDAHVTNERGRMDASLLLGAVGRVWTLTDHQAIPHLDGTAAIGSGDEAALGALWVMRGDDLSPEMVVQSAIEAACAVNAHTEKPVVVECV